MGIRGILGVTCREARTEVGLSLADVAGVAGVSVATVHRFEGGCGWPRETDRIVEAYERLCGLEPLELWRRAVGC